ncbi:MAG: DUF2306 domain-containing protein [Maritimibacter sp.]
MTLDPLLSAGPAIQLHVLAALLTIALLPFTLFRRRKDRIHKVAGYVWVCAMLVTSISSFWITGIRLVGPFSPIHLLSVVVIYNVIWALREVLRGHVRRHELILKGTAFWSLGVAGLFTLLPGRLMNEALFGAAPVAGFTVAFALATLTTAHFGFPRGFREVASAEQAREGESNGAESGA